LLPLLTPNGPSQVPSPVRAVLLLFPITPASEAAKAAQEERIAKDGQEARRSKSTRTRCVGRRKRKTWLLRHG
jgi:hypothetical protein